MEPTKAHIRQWLEEGKDKQALYTLICWDKFDNSHYPVHIVVETDLEKKIESNQGDLVSVMEVYAQFLPFDEQLEEYRAWHTEPPLKPELKDSGDLVDAQLNKRRRLSPLVKPPVPDDLSL